MKKTIISFIIFGLLGSVSGCDDSTKNNANTPHQQQTDQNQHVIPSTADEASPTLAQIKKYIFDNTKELGAVDSVTLTQVDDNDISAKERNRADVLNYEIKEYIIHGKYHLTDDIYEQKKHPILIENKQYYLWTQPIKANQSLDFTLKASMQKKDQYGWRPAFSDFVSSPELPQKIYTEISQPERAILYGSETFDKIKNEALVALNDRNAQCNTIENRIKDISAQLSAMTDKGERSKNFFKLKNEKSDLSYSYSCLKAYQSRCYPDKKTPVTGRKISQYIGFLTDAGETPTDDCTATPK